MEYLSKLNFNYYDFSPDRSGKHLGIKNFFSWYKKATNGSSFYALEKFFLYLNLETYSWK